MNHSEKTGLLDLHLQLLKNKLLDTMGCVASRALSRDSDWPEVVVVASPSKASKTAAGSILPFQDRGCSMDDSDTSIQDLPPLLLAHILSRCGSWKDLFSTIPLVCKTWKDVSQCATPERLAFEFTVSPEGSLGCPMMTTSTKHDMQQQNDSSHVPTLATNSSVPPGATINTSCLGQVIPLLQCQQEQGESPVFTWLRQHRLQVKELSVSMRAADAGLAAVQCVVKEQLLKALAGIELSNSRNCFGDSFKPVSSSCQSLGSGVMISPDGQNGKDNAPSSCSATCDSCFPPCSHQRLLQLRSMKLRLPLFEDDINLLADGVCSRAPHLEELTMIGFASSGSLKQAHALSSLAGLHHTAMNIVQAMSSSSSHLSVATSRPALNSPGYSNTTGTSSVDNNSNGAVSQEVPGQAGSTSTTSTSTNTSTSTSSSSSSSGSNGQHSSLKSHGFITGSSLQHLMSSAKHLKSFSFASRQLYKASWLAPATQLTHLALCDCQLGDVCLQDVCKLKLPLLQHLDLSGNAGLGAAGSTSFQLVAQLTRLQVLNISGWNLSSVAGSNSCSEDVAQALQPLQKMASLQALHMDGCRLVHFSSRPFIQLRQLVSLSLADNPLKSSAVNQVCRLTQLQQLDLSGICRKGYVPPPLNGVASDGCWSGFKALPRLQELRLAGNYWPDCYPQPVVMAFLQQLCPSISSCSSLRVLSIAECKFPHKLMQALMRTLPASLNKVVLDGCVGVTRCDLEVLADLPGLLSVSAAALNPPLRDKHCSVLAKCGQVRELNLAGNDIGPKGLAVLSSMLQLKQLDVAGNDKLLASAGTMAASAGW